MSTLPASQVRGRWAEVVDRVRVRGERVVVERNGRPVVAVVSIEDLDAIERLEDAIDRRAARAALARGNFIPWEEVKKSLDQKTPKETRGRRSRASRGAKPGR
jgi:prevent-host-death family protein